jgi:uncharacterized membrane protein YhdT
MPSLHFGYSLLIGLTIATIPLDPLYSKPYFHILPGFNRSHPDLATKLKIPSWRRMACVLLAILYPCIILLVILATVNYFILDAVVGAWVVGLRGGEMGCCVICWLWRIGF